LGNGKRNSETIKWLEAMRTYKLKQLLSIKNGRDHKELNSGNIPVYGSGGIMRYGDKAMYNDESILLPRKGTLANIQYVNKPFWTVDTIYYSIVNKELANPFYLFNFLKVLDLSKLNTGTGVPSMTFDSYYNLDIVLPELEVQQKIASVLAALDSKIELNNRINAELEAMAKTLYDYWFVQFDFPDKNGKPYKSSGGKMVWNEELKREIPEGWEKGSLSSLGDIIGGSTPPREIEEYFTTNGTAWITPKDLSLNAGNKFIAKGELDVSDKGIKTASLNIMPKGTILLSSRAPVGYLAISREDVTINQGFKSFVPNKGFSTEFVYYSIKNMIPTIENNAVGSTFKEISAGTLKTIPIYLPDKKVVDNYTDIVKPIFERQNSLEVENQKLTELRDWLLPMLMNGQVKVS
jgi:type I restriction enzyme S subunit